MSVPSDLPKRGTERERERGSSSIDARYWSHLPITADRLSRRQLPAAAAVVVGGSVINDYVTKRTEEKKGQV